MLDIRIPFQLKKMTLYLPTWNPLKVELKVSEGDYMLLTPNTPEWDPHKIMHMDQEHAIAD